VITGMPRPCPASRRPHMPASLLDVVPPEVLRGPRSAESVSEELRELQRRGELELPLPGGGRTASRWAALAHLGRRDLCLARLAEGHADATAILVESGRVPRPTALYGVWASRSSGTGASVRRQDGKYHLSGTVRFCSGAGYLDRALVAAALADVEGSLLLEVDLGDPRVQPKPDSWPAIGMDASSSLEVAFDDLVLPEEAAVGPESFYTRRCGFALGGAGVAAVWLGGAVGALDLAMADWSSGRSPGPHRLAHLGALHTQLASTDALFVLAAEVIDSEPSEDHELLVGTCRSAAEKTAREVIDVVPRLVGPGPLCWDRRLAQHLADLQVYVRQHHGEADLAALGSRILSRAPRRS
jgi:hypothetical protein